MRHRIAVVGAGPAGLTFARTLLRHGHQVTVLERDPSAGARPPGGALDLHRGLGQLALDKAGLSARFREVARPEGQAMRILDVDGTVLRDWGAGADAEGGGNPEIDRGQLRDLLLGSLDVDLDVEWGRVVTRVVVPSVGSRGRGGGVRVECADGFSAEFDLVVGADGAWSRVRPVLSPELPRYTGVTYVETFLDDVDAAHPDLAALVGDGSLAVYGVNRSVVAQRNSGGHVKVYAKFRAPLDWHAAAGLDLDDPDAVRAHLLGMYEGWADPVLELLRRGTVFVHRPLHVLPIHHTWPHTAGVTLIGDAAHLMPPLGAGANLAMLEGAELAEAVAANPGDPAALDEAVQAFERAMWARAGRWAQHTSEGLEQLVSQDPAAAVALFDAVQPS